MSLPDLERPTPQPLTIDSPLPVYTAHLIEGAQSALRQPTFLAKTQRMARIVGQETSLLAARSIGKPGAADRLSAVFTSAASVAGNKFQGAFNEWGRPLGAKGDGSAAEASYNQAMKDAKVAAYEHLPSLYKAANVEVDNIDELVRGLNFTDALRFTAGVLDVELPPGLTAEEIQRSLHITAAGDYYEKLVDTLPFAEADATPRTDDEVAASDLAIRMANATWKEAQIHKAAWTGNDGIIDPEKNVDFNPYDVHLKTAYEQVSQAPQFSDSPPHAALIAAAFAVYKDIDNLHRAIPSEPAA